MYYTPFQSGICLQCSPLYITSRIRLDKYHAVKAEQVHGIRYDYSYLHFSGAYCIRGVMVTNWLLRLTHS